LWVTIRFLIPGASAYADFRKEGCTFVLYFPVSLSCRPLPHRFTLTVFFFALLALFLPSLSQADVPPAQLLPGEVARQDANKETITAPTPGLLLTPKGAQADGDEKYRQRYHAACYVYIGEVSAGSGSAQPVSYQRRFAVHAPELDALPLTKRVARMLLLLYGLNRDRLHYDHAFHQTVDVWLSGQSAPGSSPDVGGEQFKNQIYIYNIFAERKPIEWAREVAHEYGHYALPGISGFKAPEEWANGVLGERLLLKWIGDDLQAGRMKADDLPFVKREDVDEYVSKQVTPLIRRIAHDGITEAALARRDAGAMDLYTGLALYVDTAMGTNALLNAISYTEPKTAGAFAQAPDFLRGVQTSLQGATEIIYTSPLPAHEGKADFWVYLPRGEYTLETGGAAKSWVFASDAKTVHAIGRNGILINAAAWRKLTLRFGEGGDTPARLILRRRGAEIQ
jgi:hypothetical protein